MRIELVTYLHIMFICVCIIGFLSFTEIQIENLIQEFVNVIEVGT